MANIKEARMCQTCQGAGVDAYGYTCGACNGYGAVVSSVAQPEPAPEAVEPERKVIVPQVDQYDFIAKRMKELEAERTEALNTPDEPPTGVTPAQYTSEAGEDFYMWGY